MLVDVHEALLASPRLVGVRQSYGAAQEAGESSPTRIAWIPTTDRYERHPVRRRVLVWEGQRVEIDSAITRWAGCDLDLYVPKTGDPRLCHRTLERLINSLHLALRDTLRTDTSYQIHDGAMIEAEAFADGTIGYRQPISVGIPIFDQLPTAPILTTSQTLIST